MSKKVESDENFYPSDLFKDFYFDDKEITNDIDVQIANSEWINDWKQLFNNLLF